MAEELENVRGGVNSSYGAEQCNKLLMATRQLASEDTDVPASLQDLTPLDTVPSPFLWVRLGAETPAFLAKIKGALRALIGLHMDQKERQRLGV
jgi:hypothetical protein